MRNEHHRSGLPATAAHAPRSAVRVLALVAIAGVTSGIVLDDEQRNPAYWADRMEQALLPKASLRASFILETHGRTLPARRIDGRLMRIQGPSSIRSVVTVDRPRRARQVLKVTSLPDGALEKELYTGGKPFVSRGSTHDPLLRSALAFEDLGFVEIGALWRDAAVEFENTLGDRVVRLTAEPYGPYEKVVARLDPSTALPRSIEYFDGRAPGSLVRRVTYRRIEREGLFRFPLRIEAVEIATGRRSTMRFEAVKLGPEIYEYEFGERHLQRTLRSVKERGGIAPAW